MTAICLPLFSGRLATWTAAQAFARSVGKRLPTEEEWEVAARGKQRNDYPWGSEFEPGRCNMAGSGINTTIEVGYFTEGASPFECMDMAGNVWEWVEDDWHTDYNGPRRSPKLTHLCSPESRASSTATTTR